MEISNNIDYSSLNIKLRYTSTHLDCSTCSQHTGIQYLQNIFLELSDDEETKAFIYKCINNSNYHLIKSTYVLPWFLKIYSLPDTNAMLGTGKMFMFSKSHLSK